MSYTINLTNGAIYATISDGDIDTTSSLVLIGKNYIGYGEFIAENFIRTLENGANPSGPANPLIGQMWYDTAEDKLKVYDNLKNPRTIGITAAATAEPASASAGDLWFDTVTNQLNVYNGTAYDLVGPLYSSVDGISGPVISVITDTSGADHIVTINWSEDEIISISHKDIAFTAQSPPPGFPGLILPGVQLADDINGQTPKFIGTATNADQLDNIDSTGFLSAINDDATTGTLGVLNDGGLTVGANSDLIVGVDGVVGAYIANAIPDGKIFIRAKNTAGTVQDVISVISDGTDVRARVDTPLVATDIANKDYVISRIEDSIANENGTTLVTVRNANGDLGTATTTNGLQVEQITAGFDAFIQFAEASGAFNFGRDGSTNDLFVGGGDMGAVKNKIWHAGNGGAGSGQDADLLDGQEGAFYQNASNLNAGTLPAGRFTNTSHGSRSGGSLHSGATTGAAGFMSTTDKSRLDSIWASNPIGDAGTLRSGNGYMKFSNNMIWQWGTRISTQDAVETFNLTLTNPNATLAVIIGNIATDGSFTWTNSQFTLNRINVHDNNEDFVFFAIGY